MRIRRTKIMKYYRFFINTLEGEKLVFIYSGIEYYAAVDESDAVNIFHQNILKSGSISIVKKDDIFSIVPLSQAKTFTVEEQVNMPKSA